MKIHYKLPWKWDYWKWGQSACGQDIFPNWTTDPRKVTCLDCKKSKDWQYAMDELDYRDEMDMYEGLRRGL